MTSTLSQVLDTLNLEQANAEFFVGRQFDAPGHHILGGHIAAQALMAGARSVAGRQYGAVLMEATASFSTAVDGLEYQPAMPAAPDPETLVSVPQHGEWASPDWFERRNIAIGEAAAGTRLWLRPNGNTPADPILASCLLTYLSAVTRFEPALTPRRKTDTAHSNSAMRDHSVFSTGRRNCRTGCSTSSRARAVSEVARSPPE